MRYLANVTSLALDPEKCTGCGRCTEVCPHNVFALEESSSTPAPPPQGEGTGRGSVRRIRILDRDACMECGACSRNCEFGALSVNAGVGCAAALINSMVTGGPPSCDCSGDSAGGCC